MKNNHVGGFKNRNAPTIIEITVVETHVMVKMVIEIYFGMKLEQLRHLSYYKKVHFFLSDFRCDH